MEFGAAGPEGASVVPAGRPAPLARGTNWRVVREAVLTIGVMTLIVALALAARLWLSLHKLSLWHA
jgi:hypothetical protein